MLTPLAVPWQGCSGKIFALFSYRGLDRVDAASTMKGALLEERYRISKYLLTAV